MWSVKNINVRFRIASPGHLRGISGMAFTSHTTTSPPWALGRSLSVGDWPRSGETDHDWPWDRDGGQNAASFFLFIQEKVWMTTLWKSMIKNGWFWKSMKIRCSFSSKKNGTEFDVDHPERMMIVGRWWYSWYLLMLMPLTQETQFQIVPVVDTER